MTDPDYFTLTEFRALPDMSDTNAYPDAKVLVAAAYFTAIVENEVGVALVVRSYTQTLDGSYMSSLWLDHSNVTGVTAVSVDGNTVATNLLNFTSLGQVRYLSGMSWSGVTPGNVVVTYTAGQYDQCPADIKDAVMWATRDRLLQQQDDSGAWDRKSAVTTDMGTVSYILPGEKRPTGYPDLDAVIASRQRSLGPSAG